MCSKITLATCFREQNLLPCPLTCVVSKSHVAWARLPAAVQEMSLGTHGWKQNTALYLFLFLTECKGRHWVIQCVGETTKILFPLHLSFQISGNIVGKKEFASWRLSISLFRSTSNSRTGTLRLCAAFGWKFAILLPSLSQRKSRKPKQQCTGSWIATNRIEPTKALKLN